MHTHTSYQSMVNKVLFSEFDKEVTAKELTQKLYSMFPNIPVADRLYVSELIKGTLCDLTLNGSIKKIDDVRYYIPEK